MRDFIIRLPEEIEKEIRDYLIPSGRLSLLLYKYPISQMDSFFKGFSKEKLDSIYRYGCYEKIDFYNYTPFNISNADPLGSASLNVIR